MAAKMIIKNVIFAFLVLITFELDLCHTRSITDRCKDYCESEYSHVDQQTVQDRRRPCGTHCLDQCGVGCEIWRSSLQMSCLEACNITLEITEDVSLEETTTSSVAMTESDHYSIQVAQCVRGCDTALDLYVNDTNVLLSNLSSPVLVAGSKTNETVILEWKRPHVANVTYVLQKLYVNLSEEWEQQKNVTWTEPNNIQVVDLHPYVTYKFRVVVVVSPQHTVISPESVPIPTKDSGVPSGVPIVQSLSASSTSVHLKWKAPYFVNAPLLGYKLSIAQDNGVISDERIKDISGRNQEVVSEVITLLRPDTQYIVKVAARNRYGIGPPVEKVVRTQPRSTTEGTKPYLILGSDEKIVQQDLYDLFMHFELYKQSNSSNLIKGLAIHYERRQIYFVDSDGVIQVLHFGDSDLDLEQPRLHTAGSSRTVRVIHRSSDGPQAMSVDWLYNNLYIAENNKITRCTIKTNHSDCRVIVSDLPSRPEEIRVDPCNGYLFWVQRGVVGGGLYRVDLNDLSGRSPLSNPKLSRIVIDTQMTAFVVDYPNFRILFPNETRNSLMSVYLDGTDLQDIRQDMPYLQFINVRSMTLYNSALYWTNGKQVTLEEYNSKEGKYIHNPIFLAGDTFTGLNIWHHSSQPLPVPLMPPKKLEVLFSADAARLSWQEPDMDQGRGAWHAWKYEIEEVNHPVTGSNGSYTQLSRWVAEGLQHNTLYSYRARAFSDGGHGPWSVVVNGTTLKPDLLEPYLLFVNDQNVCKINLDGTEQVTVFDLSMYRRTVTKVETYGKMHFFTLSNGSVVLQEGNSAMRVLPGIYGASVLTYEWLAGMIYWSSERHNMIQRVRLRSGSVRQPETIHQGASPVQDIALDSEKGFIYWTTLHTIEMSRLSGRGHRRIQNVGRLSGRYILGLAIDLYSESLYWVMKAGNELTFFKMQLITRDVTESHSFSFSAESTYINRASYPSLQYYSNKLFWTSEYNTITVQDLRGKSLASIQAKTSTNLTDFTVVHQGKGHRPGSTTSNQSVIPPAVRLDTVRISGKAENFQILWTPVSISTVDEVFYNILIECPDRKPISRLSITDPHVTLNNIEPYSNLTLTLTACTHWGCNDTEKNTIVKRSPEAAPSVPTRPRKFVTYHRHPLSTDITIEVEFRWSRPEKMNGVLTQYIVERCDDPVTSRWRGIIRDKPLRRYWIIQPAAPNTSYYFRSKACTKEGCGPFTDTVHVNTADEKPVPMLLAIDSRMLRLFLVDDKDYKANITEGQILSLTYIAQENTFYWIDGSRDIKKLHGRNDTNEERIVETEGQAKGLTTDWIGRNLYWLEDKPVEQNRIMKYSLERDHSETQSVLTRHATLWHIAVDPLHSTMFWTETRNNSGYLMRCRIDGSDIHSIILTGNSTTQSTTYRYKNEDRINRMKSRQGRKKSRQYRQRAPRARRAAPCNCPQISIGPVFELDPTVTDQTVIYIVDNRTGSIWATDADGCFCRMVVDAEAGPDMGLPPDSMTVDLDRLYWTNKQQALVNSVLKNNGTGFVQEKNHNAPSVILAYGKHLQPMPDPECLLAVNYSHRPGNIVTTNTTATLVLIPWQYAAKCDNISVPDVKYTLLYRDMKHDSDFLDCGSRTVCYNKSTYDPAVTLESLTPDKLYQVQILVSNVYTRGPNRPSVYGIFKTKKGIPSEPRNVHMEVLTSALIKVLWQVPENLNGPSADVNYLVDWYANSPNETRTEDKYDLFKDDDNQVYYFTMLPDLSPNQTYYAKVRACDRNRTGYNASPRVSATTYQLPGSVEAEAINCTAIRVSWEIPEDGSVSRHQFQCSTANNPDQFHLDSRIYFTNKSQSSDSFVFDNLIAASTYHFRMSLVYRKTDLVFWPPVPITLSTPVGPPSRPGPPEIPNSHSPDKVVEWEAPYDGGEPIQAYLLEYLDFETNNWTLVYNDSDRKWIITGITPRSDQYVFRVAAMNVVGLSEFSINKSLSILPVQDLHLSDRLTFILAPVFAGTVFVVVLLIALLIRYRNSKEHKQITFSIVPGNRNSPDMELATLRELPHVTVQTSNALYAINIIPTDEDVAALPHFRRDQLRLTKFLGSGAFGEVFEGLARNILNFNSGETRVAVKTLRKGATDQEKEEFLKEALLMSNFKYDLILRLLGVCLENDPQFIILELMEGGDLLSYLRSSRPTPTSPAKLSLPDMVGICVDVSMGCRYLEDMHFVHRDLAARNCLVSSRNPELRVVKIGDFGLARDIYKNDYYRKEGEGLLPVRWMSPESLIDGVFTTQSDVWAFGVLMWEVLTLGQQPYPARTNLEVLHFVRSGGRLDRPDNCPDDLYTLMLKCWRYNPDERPSFTYILSQLEGFKQRSLDPSSDFSGRIGEVAVLPPLACTSRLYDDDLRHLNATISRQLPAQTPGVNGVVKLPPLEKSDFKFSPRQADVSGSSSSIHKGEQQQTLERVPSTPRLSVSSGDSGQRHSRREDEHGYLSPLTTANHKYLELVSSTDLGYRRPDDRASMCSTNSQSGSSRPSSNNSLDVAVRIPNHVPCAAATAESTPCIRQPSSPGGSEEGSTQEAGDNNNKTSMASKDPKTGKTVYYTPVATSSPEGESGAPKVRTPYRGPHSQAWACSNTGNLPVLRDIAGRSVPPPNTNKPAAAE